MTAPSEHAPAASGDAQQHQEHDTGHGFRRKMTGRVISAKMQKTVVVEVVNHRRDPLYGKYVRSRARYKAHDETNQYKPGDQVEIQEHSPMSRDKRWLVTRLVKKYVEE
jgi:small subunit ribosomal protein S17